MYNLRRLVVLRELKHRGTLAAVASAMSYSPSAVSQQLTSLESEVGAPLLEREGRGVRLTPQAEILVARTEKALRELERAEAEIAASLRETTG
ncbi:LysR family transcriptional regulator, partial [Streptomyces sp. NPDC006386]